MNHLLPTPERVVTADRAHVQLPLAHAQKDRSARRALEPLSAQQPNPRAVRTSVRHRVTALPTAGVRFSRDPTEASRGPAGSEGCAVRFRSFRAGCPHRKAPRRLMPSAELCGRHRATTGRSPRRTPRAPHNSRAVRRRRGAERNIARPRQGSALYWRISGPRARKLRDLHSFGRGTSAQAADV